MWTAWLTVKHTLLQFWALFGIFLLGGFLLTWLSRLTNNTFNQFRFPRFPLYVFGWIGVPAHELSHAIFCKLFLHEIKSVKWFDARAKGGAHGSVTHLYNPWNIYHRIGHFFIGLGPAILGPVFMALLFYFLVPGGREIFSIAQDAPWMTVVVSLAKTIALPAVWKSPLFYVFVYLAICISSQIELSPEDLKQVVTGVFPILIALWLGNVLAWAAGAAWHPKALHIGNVVFGLMASMFAFATFLSLLNLLLCTLVFGVINRLSGHPGINPLVNASAVDSERS